MPSLSKNPKGFIIAGTHSGVGKTTITLGLMSVFKKKGLLVQPFKAGPDYIDPSFHRLVCNKPSYNLDTWMMGVNGVKKTFANASAGADINIVEGVMGLFDGKHGEGDFGSTAHIAKILKLPVILVIDAGKMAQSAGAVVYGFEKFDPKVNIAGVIFNRVGSDRHFNMLKSAVEKQCKAKVLGYMPKDEEIKLSERHLGLTTIDTGCRIQDTGSRTLYGCVKYAGVKPAATSKSKTQRFGMQDARFKKIEALIESFVDVDGLMRLLRLRLAMTGKEARSDKGVIARALARSNLNLKSAIVKIAVAYDSAFCFYYQENLDILKKLGADIKFFSPLKDKKLPDNISGIYFGGGYPELYAKRLSANKTIMKQIKNLAQKGLPIYAECGGLMYLGKGLKDLKGAKYDMTGIFSWTSQMLEKRKAIGYREAAAYDGCPFLEKGQKIRGHEFHYSEINPPLPPFNKGGMGGLVKRVYRLTSHISRLTASEGYVYKNTLASYVHLHFASNKKFAKGFIKKCEGYKNANTN